MTMDEVRLPGRNDTGEVPADPLVTMAELMAGTTDIDRLSAHVVGTCAGLPAVDGAAVHLAVGVLGPHPSAQAGAVLRDFAVRLPCQGPTEEVLRTGRSTDLPVAAAGERWPLWAQVMTELGIARVTCVPLGLVDRVVGGLELYSRGDQPLHQATWRSVHGLCALLSVALGHEAELGSRVEQVRQLTDALQRRVAVEQAKGYLCACGFTDPDDAFHVLRHYARRARRSVDAVARDVVSGRLGAESLVAASRSPR
jgi:GAF domain-containing protein